MQCVVPAARCTGCLLSAAHCPAGDILPELDGAPVPSLKSILVTAVIALGVVVGYEKYREKSDSR